MHRPSAQPAWVFDGGGTPRGLCRCVCSGSEETGYFGSGGWSVT
jgi:hypothetical protein